jgi:hypothetical protein
MTTTWKGGKKSRVFSPKIKLAEYLSQMVKVKVKINRNEVCG